VEYTYIVTLAPVGVSVQKVLTSNKHIGSYMFEVPEQEVTFGLPTGVVRIVFQEFDLFELLGKTKDTVISDIHDINRAPELYARLAKIAKEGKVKKPPNHVSRVHQDRVGLYGCGL
jgi:hypothetical protein